jgi:RNA polymerase sigma-70 factor (ECF subfamily)
MVKVRGKHVSVQRNFARRNVYAYFQNSAELMPQTAASVALYYRLGSAFSAKRGSAVEKLSRSRRPVMQSDSQLVSSALQGDQVAFATLVGRYQRAARATAFHRLGDHHAAEDAAQEAFVTAYQKLRGLREGSRFGPWLLAIVRHKAERVGRARRRDVPLDHAAHIAGIEGIAMDQDAEHLLAAVMGMPERERQLLMLRHFGGHSVADIAEIVGRPVGTVTKQLSRSYARLRKQFATVER